MSLKTKFLACLLVALGGFLGYVVSVHLGLLGHAPPAAVNADEPVRTPRKAGDKPAEKSPRKGEKPNIVFLLADNLPVSGFSVTIPHKQKVLRYLDTVDPLTRRIGAVNTVWKKAGKWRGANTDAPAVTVPLSRHLRLSKSSVLLVGNGGAARGAAFALVDSGVRLSIVGRNPDRVRSLAK